MLFQDCLLTSLLYTLKFWANLALSIQYPSLLRTLHILLFVMRTFYFGWLKELLPALCEFQELFSLIILGEPFPDLMKFPLVNAQISTQSKT